MDQSVIARLNSEIHPSILTIVQIRESSPSDALRFEAAKYLLKMAPDGPEKDRLVQEGARIAITVGQRSLENALLAIQDVDAKEVMDLLPTSSEYEEEAENAHESSSE